MSWESFRARPDNLDYTSFEEEGSGSALDVALFNWGGGAQHVGRTVTAMELLTMLAPGNVRSNGLKTQVLEVVGWWTIFFPWTGLRCFTTHVGAQDCNQPAAHTSSTGTTDMDLRSRYQCVQ